MIAAAALVIAGSQLMVFPKPAIGGGCGTVPKDLGFSHGIDQPRFLTADNVNLICSPAVIHGTEGKWTFLIKGPTSYQITEAVLSGSGSEYPSTRIETPTPGSAMIDFEFPTLDEGQHFELTIRDKTSEMARFTILVTAGHKVKPSDRQKALLRVQLSPWTLLYPLHGFRGEGRRIPHREVDELVGDDDFIAALRAMGVERLRKIMSRYAEDDSMHWDKRFERYNYYRGTQLRSYIFHVDSLRSEAAYKELFLSLPQVEKAFINEDRKKNPKKK